MLGQKGRVIWLTGLSGSSKSTIARELEEQLYRMKKAVYVLDGDLGFSATDRAENLRGITEVAGLFADAGLIVLVSFITPYQHVRDAIRHKLGNDLCLVYVDAPLAVCEDLDSKGLYEKARKGEISNFTGIDDPYDVPKEADLHVRTDKLDVKECTNKIVEYLSLK